MNRFFYLSHIFCRMYPFPLIISRQISLRYPFRRYQYFCMGIVRYPVHDIFSARDLSAVIHRKTLSSRFHGRYQILYPYRFPSDRQPLHHGRENLPVSSRNMEMDIFVPAVHHQIEPPCTLRRQKPAVHTGASCPGLLIHHMAQRHIFCHRSRKDILHAAKAVGK